MTLGGAAAAGVAVTVSLAMAAGMTRTEALRIAVIAAGPAVAAALVGMLVLAALRRAALGVQAAVVVIASIAAVAAGAALAARSMFISSHDLQAIGVILAAAATVGVVIAAALGLLLGRAVATLRITARRMGRGDARVRFDQPGPSELSALARELDDMTERLEEAARRERAVESSRRELVAWMSHDLRTPLAAIRAMAEALEDGVVDDPATMARYHRTVRAEADRLSAMVDDLFELSRINAGALRLHVTRVALDDLVSDAMAGASALARRKGVELTGQVNSASPTVSVSAAEVGRALRNLLENAIRHTPADGAVAVETGLDGERAYVSIADQCGGIPDEDLDRVFEMAFRGHAARTPEPDAGAGLGLAIARGIAEAHHGELSVRNDGPGCRFTLRLPLEQPA